MTDIQKFKIAQNFSPADKVPEQCDQRRYTDFVTEDAGGGDATPPVILEVGCTVLLAGIIILGAVLIGHYALYLVTGVW